MKVEELLMSNCVYCKNRILQNSKEHVIQNAIGGLYESTDICCPECNNHINKFIDVPFTKIFAPITDNIKNLNKTNNKNSHPSYSGKIVHNNRFYDATIKNNKVVSSPKLSKELKTDVKKLNTNIIYSDFKLDNNIFKNGLAKIAFNFAIAKGVSPDLLLKYVNIETQNTNIKNISFQNPVLPFVALNSIDKEFELETEMDIYHNLILFNQGNNLWCYVDLFNTFQYYVYLSKDYSADKQILETYIQQVQQNEKNIPDIQIRKLEDIQIYTTQYNLKIKINLNDKREKIAENIKQAISEQERKKSQVKDMGEYFSKKYILGKFCFNNMSNKEKDEFLNIMSLYFDEDERLNVESFRLLTYIEDYSNCVSYPAYILENHIILGNQIHKYTSQKFNRLITFLNK